jgi:hypothetical protein
MKHSRLILGGALLAAIGIATFVPRLSRNHSVPSDESATPLPMSTLSSSREVPKPVEQPTTPELPAAREPALDLPSIHAQTVQTRTIRADTILASINGKPIQLKDLVPLAPEDTEKTMSAEQYESRLDRAIEMELTAQAAQTQGVSLTDEQQQRLSYIAEDHEENLRDYKEDGISWTSVTAAQISFEQRLTSALMLQQNLVAKETSLTPSPDQDVQAGYEEALRDLLSRLKANGNIAVNKRG